MKYPQENKTTVKNNGIGFAGLLQLLFIGLKLTGYINWSWWIVLLQLEISIGVFFLALCLLAYTIWRKK